MKRLTRGYEAFYIALYLNDNLIFDITNVGVGTQLDMALFDYGDIPVSELKKLGDEVRNGLREQLQIEFEVVRVDPESS